MSKKLGLILRIVAAGILLQTLYFKFTGAPESIFIFSTLKVEPWGRWVAGFSELVASAALLIPATQLIGALLGIGIMAGAILSHVVFLGIVVQDDGGLLFALACIVAICCVGILYLKRSEIPAWIDKMKHLIGSQGK